jgi:hypothetical protein
MHVGKNFSHRSAEHQDANMNPRQLWILSISIACFAVPARAEVKLVPVQYKHGDDMLEGWLAFDDAKASDKKPAPGVIVCPSGGA